MLYVREFSAYKPWIACRILVVVGNNGKADVEEYLEKSVDDNDFKKIARVIAEAVKKGPDKIHNNRTCRKIINDKKKPPVFEFKAKDSLLRVFWFREEKGDGIPTIILTHAAHPAKGKPQEAEFDRVYRIANEYFVSPFPWYDDKK